MLLMNAEKRGRFSALEGHFGGQKGPSKADLKDGQGE
jgi:hypothetical protein